MIYRCDLQHFLSYAIDYLTLEELTSMQYAIISAKISSGGKLLNVVKINALYPDIETIVNWSDLKDKKIMRKMYLEMLDPKDNEIDGLKRISNPYDVQIYQTFINPLLEHYNVMIMCDRVENHYIDVLCEHLKKKFHIEVIDLNELFDKGKIGPIYIDRDEIHDAAVDIRRASAKEEIRNMASTRDGKASLITKMTKKEKMKQLKRYGATLRPGDNIDEVLLEEWCAEDGIE